jgi:signal peptidase I
MGDHRTNSTDSRARDVGPVPVANVIGRAWLRYWPLGKLGLLEAPSYPNLTPATGRQ